MRKCQQIDFSGIAVKSQICTCHDSWAVVACAKLWPDWIIRIQTKPKGIFSRFQWWADKCFVRKVLGFDKFKKVSAAGLCIVFAIGHVSYLGGHYWDYFMGILSYCSSQCYSFYRKTSTISRTFVGNKIVDHSGVGAAPTTSSFST